MRILLLIGVLTAACIGEAIVIAQIFSTTQYATISGQVFQITGDVEIRGIQLYVSPDGHYRLNASFWKVQGPASKYKVYGSFGDITLPEQQTGNVAAVYSQTITWDLGITELKAGAYVANIYVEPIA